MHTLENVMYQKSVLGKVVYYLPTVQLTKIDFSRFVQIVGYLHLVRVSDRVRGAQRCDAPMLQVL